MQIVLKTEIKQVDGDIEQVLDKNEFVDNIDATVEVKELKLSPGATYRFSCESGEYGAAKGLRVVSKNLFRISSLNQATTTNIPFVFRDLTLFGGQPLRETSGSVYVDNPTSALGFYGDITISMVGNEPGYTPTSDYRVKIIVYY